MKFTRRSAASVLAGIPLLGTQAGKDALTRIPIGPYSLGESTSSSGGVGQFAKDACPSNGPKMTQAQAYKLAMGVPELRDTITSYVRSVQKDINRIDPDLEVLRALSPMAKITYQRQRNVRRHLESLMVEQNYSFGDMVTKFVQKCMWGCPSP